MTSRAILSLTGSRGSPIAMWRASSGEAILSTRLPPWGDKVLSTAIEWIPSWK